MRSHGDHHSTDRALLTGLGLTAGIVAAPHVLPLFGVGTEFMAAQTASLCGKLGGSGLAGAVNSGLASVPGVGEYLAAGGWTSAIASGLIGLGGSLLGSYIHKKYDQPGQIQWGKIIKYAAIATSLLVALPSILSGVSMGITFLTLAFGGAALATSVGKTLSTTLGMMPGLNVVMQTASFSGFIPHIFSCGAAGIPAIGSLFASRHEAEHDETVSMKLVHATPIVKGQPAQLGFQILNAEGKSLPPEFLTTNHTQKLHTMVVDSSLTDYHHLHPTYDPKSRMYVCEFTPNTSHSYRAWHDFTLQSNGQQHYQSLRLPTPGALPVPPVIRQTSHVNAGDISATIQPQSPLKMGEDGVLTVSLTDSNGAPVTNLEPIMGASAHLVGFSQDGNHMIHCHPLSDGANGTLKFHITPERAGPTKFFLQIKRQGHETVVPFGQMVQFSPEFTVRTQQSRQNGHSQHAIAM